MKCPYCGFSDDRVLDTREQKQKNGDIIRRRRECLQCRSRFTTIESLCFSYPYVIKKDGRREPFSKEKILKGLTAACQKRPISQNLLEEVVDRISTWVVSKGEPEISSQIVGLRVMGELRRLDDVAYVRFASVYRTFKDVQEFVDTLEEEEVKEGAGKEDQRGSLGGRAGETEEEKGLQELGLNGQTYTITIGDKRGFGGEVDSRETRIEVDGGEIKGTKVEGRGLSGREMNSQEFDGREVGRGDGMNGNGNNETGRNETGRTEARSDRNGRTTRTEDIRGGGPEGRLHA